MRKVLLIGLALALLAGCDKLRGSKAKTDTTAATDAPTTKASGGSGDQPGVHAPTGIVIKPLQGGGSGGAVQAVRGAVNRSVNEQELKQIHYYIETAYTLNGRMPTADEIKREVQKDNSKLYKLLEDGSIQLSGTKSRDNIWAATMFPQTGTMHSVLTSKGVERMDVETLKTRLKQQEGQ